MDYPIPTHLKEFFVLLGDNNDEYEVTGKIHCTCGCEIFEVWESNNRQLVKLKCKDCGKEFEILDTGKHGWNGFVCKEDDLNRNLSLNKYICNECEADSFRVSVCISSQGKADFIDECVSNDELFSEDDWINGFEWIRISLSCMNCSNDEENWCDLETT